MCCSMLCPVQVDHHSFIPPSAKKEVDDDPLGLGLGSSAPPPHQQQQPVLGLSDMTGLGATLPSSGGMGFATSVASGQQVGGGLLRGTLCFPLDAYSSLSLIRSTSWTD